MKRWKNIFSYVIAMMLAVTCVVAFNGCGTSSNKSANAEKTLTYASPDCKTINPVLNTHDELPDLIFSGLMKHDGNGKPVVDLAEKYEFDKNTLTYTFHLHKNVKWHDGKPFTAADVKLSLIHI